MSENLARAAEVLGAPEILVQRSAEARAAADGVSVEEVLAAWAGGGAPPSPSASDPRAFPRPPWRCRMSLEAAMAKPIARIAKGAVAGRKRRGRARRR